MIDKKLALNGQVKELSRAGPDMEEGAYVTFWVDGAEPLWAELRLPNRHGWAAGDRVVISMVSVERKRMIEAA